MKQIKVKCQCCGAEVIVPEVNEQCEMPPELNHLKFITAWSEWMSFRKEIKHKLTPTTQKKQLKMLASLGVDGAVSTLNRSMENGWQGLFPEKTVQTNPLIGRQNKYINHNVL